MRRRELITLLGGAAAWPLAARAQQPGKVHRVGILWASTPSANAPRMEAFRQGLRELGYVEGRNLVIAARGAPLSARSQHSYIALVDELIRERVDVILTAGTSPTRAAKNAASAVPIVMTFVSDPIGSGFVASLARPGGNITGLANFGPELSAKWIPRSPKPPHPQRTKPRRRLRPHPRPHVKLRPRPCLRFHLGPGSPLSPVSAAVAAPPRWAWFRSTCAARRHRPRNG
jgi:putative ABC transport system substrate-binding protein